jgi:hypothetical protein
MVTLLGILVVVGIISTYRIYKSCKEQDIPFNPPGVSFMAYLGFLFGIICPAIFALLTFAYLIIKYLP